MRSEKANEFWQKAGGIINEQGEQEYPSDSTKEGQAKIKALYNEVLANALLGELGLVRDIGIVPPGMPQQDDTAPSGGTQDNEDRFCFANLIFNTNKANEIIGAGASENINQRIDLDGKDVAAFFGGDENQSAIGADGQRHHVDTVRLYITGTPTSDKQKVECDRGDENNENNTFYIPTHFVVLAYLEEKAADGQINEIGVAVGVMDRSGSIYFPDEKMSTALGLAASVSDAGFGIGQKDLEKVMCYADAYGKGTEDGWNLTENDFMAASIGDSFGYEDPHAAMMEGMAPDEADVSNAEKAIDALLKGAEYATDIAATINYIEENEYTAAADVIAEKLGAVMDAGEGVSGKTMGDLYAAIKDVQGALIMRPDGEGADKAAAGVPEAVLRIADVYQNAAEALEQAVSTVKDTDKNVDGKDIAGALLACHLVANGISEEAVIGRIGELVCGDDDLAVMAYEKVAGLIEKASGGEISVENIGPSFVLRDKDGAVPGMEEFLKNVEASAGDMDTSDRADADKRKNVEAGAALTAIWERILSTKNGAADFEKIFREMWVDAEKENGAEREQTVDGRPDIDDASGSDGADRDSTQNGFTEAGAEEFEYDNPDNETHGVKKGRSDSGDTKHGGAKVDTEKDIQISDAKIAEIKEQYGKDADEKVSELKQELNEIAKDIKHYAEIKDSCEKVLPFHLLRSYLPYLQATYGLDGAVAAAARLGADVGNGRFIQEVPKEKDFLQDRNDVHSCEKSLSHAIGVIYGELPGLDEVRFRADGKGAGAYSDYLDFSLRTAKFATAWKMYVRMGWDGLIKYLWNKHILTVEKQERDVEARGADNVSKDDAKGRDGSAEAMKEDPVDGKAGAEKNPYLGLDKEEYKQAEAKVDREGKDLDRRRDDLSAERESLDKEAAAIADKRRDLAKDRAAFCIDEAIGDGKRVEKAGKTNMEDRKTSLDEREKKLSDEEQLLNRLNDSYEDKEKAFKKDEAAHDKNVGWLKEASVEQEKNDIAKDREQADDISVHAAKLDGEVVNEKQEQNEAQKDIDDKKADIDKRRVDAEKIRDAEGATAEEKDDANTTLEGIEGEQKTLESKQDALDKQKELTDRKQKQADREHELAAAILAMCGSREKMLTDVESETGDTADKAKDERNDAGHVETTTDNNPDPMETERQNDSLEQTGDQEKTDVDGSQAQVSEDENKEPATKNDDADRNPTFATTNPDGSTETMFLGDDKYENERAEMFVADLVDDPEAIERFVTGLMEDAGVLEALEAWGKAYDAIEDAVDAKLEDPSSEYSGVDADKVHDLINDAALSLVNDTYDDLAKDGTGTEAPDTEASENDTVDTLLDAIGARLNQDDAAGKIAELILNQVEGDNKNGKDVEASDEGRVEANGAATNNSAATGTEENDPIDFT